MKENAESRPFIVWLLIFLVAFLASGALTGGGAFMFAPNRHLVQIPISHLNGSPFTNFLIPGALLFTFLSTYPLAIAYSLWKVPAWHWPDRFNPFMQLHWNWALNSSDYSGVMPTSFTGEELSQIHIPALMLIGDHDRLNPPKTIKQVKQMNPHIEAEIIPNAGHLLSMEQPELVEARLLRSLTNRN